MTNTWETDVKPFSGEQPSPKRSLALDRHARTAQLLGLPIDELIEQREREWLQQFEEHCQLIVGTIAGMLMDGNADANAITEVVRSSDARAT
jgi:hypothetical protein